MQQTDLDAWLDAMPSVSDEELDRRERALERTLAETNRKLAVIRLMRGDRPDRSRPGGASTSRPMTRPSQKSTGRKLSREREAIIRLIQQHPGGMAPIDVWKRLTADGMEVTTNAIQTTMGRMVQAGQLLRVDAGLYRLPSETSADDLLSVAGSAGEGNGHANGNGTAVMS